ncbi:MAG: hypothetical protein B6I25_03735 [Planctomycetales bacterium 4572_13]|nr:MAG: hypothetical protein B6I25_03735 [Planctomycetales bacterium 4572_13]
MVKQISKKTLIKNGRLIDPKNKIDQVTDLLVDDFKVAKIGSHLTDSAVHIIDAAGKIVAPGLIDIHVHFREPGDDEEETIASGSAAAVAGGYTSVVCMPNTHPPVDEATAVEYVHRMGRQARKTFVYVMGAITKDRAGQELAEMGLMAEAGAVGFTDDGCGLQDAAMMLLAMKYASMFDLVISQHCEDHSLAKNGVMNAGYKATVLGLPGVDPLAEEMMLWRDIQLVRKTKARYHAQHISTAGSVKIIREAKQQGLPVTCEATPHHLLLTEEAVADYDTNFKVNPPLRTQKDVESLRHAVADGVIDALATDHAPHLQSEKELEFLSAPCGMVGIECALPLYRKALIDTGVCDWSAMLAMLTWRPAEIIKVQKGSLAVGDRADIVVIDPDAQWSIDASQFYSKSRNCPYQGWQAKGKVLYTLVAGEVRFEAKG